MNQIKSFINNEFHHILRDKRSLFILLIMPVVQIVLFGFALSNEVKNTHFAVVDYSQTTESKELIHRMSASRYFDFLSNAKNTDEIDKLFKEGKIKLGVVIDRNYANDDYARGKSSHVQLLVDVSDPNTGNTILNYARQIINRDFQESHLVSSSSEINPVLRYLYNPQLLSSFNFVPGVMAMILMLVSTMMTSVSIVKEKEMGTMEVILVSPMQPLKLILAKMVPYFLISMFNVLTILAMSYFVLMLPIKGNFFLLLFESSIFIITCLSFGFFISTITDSQESAMFVSLIAMFLPTLMLSGYMFPLENLPLPLRAISNVIPARWFYSVLKNVMLKGLGFFSVWKENLIMIFMTLFMISLSIKKFKLRLE